MALGLRGRFTLFFGIAALVTIAAAAVITREVVANRYRGEFDRQLRAAENDAQRQVRQLQTAVLGALAGFAARENPIVGAVLIDLRKNQGELSPDQHSELLRRAEGVMRALGVDVLVVVDRGDQVLAAPHIPASVGDRDVVPRELAARPPGAGPVLIWSRVEKDGTLERVPVMASARTVADGGAQVTVLVGRIVGQELTEAVHRDGVVEARLTDAAGKVLASSEPAWDRHLRTAPSVDVPLVGSDGKAVAHFIVAAPAGELERTLTDVTIAAAAFGILAVLAALTLGFLVARRITGDLDALLAGAQAVRRGDLAHRVEVHAKDEIGQLAGAFNAMTTELAESKERLVQAERVAAWQDIARSIAHEIKNPLTPIQMSVETLRKSYTTKHRSFDEIFEESTRTVLEEVARLKRIVSEFSQFARLPRPAVAPLDLDELVVSALSLYRGHVKVVRELAGNLPSIGADRDQLTQVILNLLENARDAVASKGSDESMGRITVRTRIGHHGGASTVELEVEDNGPGFDAALKDKLFEPYFTTKTGGTGLGLAIVRRIVTEHGGRIGAASTERGALFTVELPASPRS
jgi:signal transduction histidine kinase